MNATVRVSRPQALPGSAGVLISGIPDMTTPSNVELGHELRDVAACLRRVMHRDPVKMVEALSDLAKRVDRAAGTLAPDTVRALLPRVMPVAETRFSTGPIVVKGRMIQVERRRAA